MPFAQDRLFYPEERADELAHRALRLKRRGELRRAALCLREATALGEPNPARWMLYGHMLQLLGQRDEAERAMKQALYLRQRRGETRKANVIRGLILRR